MQINDLPVWAAAIALSVATYKALAWVFKHTIFKYNFMLRFIDHPPPDSTVHNFWFSYSLPVGKFRLCCSLKAAHAFHPVKINFRFLNPDESNVSPSIVQITKIEECECDHRFIESTIPDTEGGIDGLYKNHVPSMARGEGRYFWMTGRASESWNGFLTFRAQDAADSDVMDNTT